MTLKASGDGRAFILPQASAAEAALVREAVVFPARSLLDVCAHLTGQEGLPRLTATREVAGANTAGQYPDLAEVKGQPHARRALEIAAAGSHSLLMAGPPGTGKSMLAQRLPGILPGMSESDALEAAAIQSLTGGFRLERWGQRPYRAPHHTASAVALVGGGSDPRPGEISLAHHGVLFLDELAEYPRHLLDALREPLETGAVHLSRATGFVRFPARPLIAAAMNPCPCGYLGHPRRGCACAPAALARHAARVSGPVLDRLDLQVEVTSLTARELAGADTGETSATVAARVAEARERQRQRGALNSQLLPKRVREVCGLDSAGESLAAEAVDRAGFSARGVDRALRVARTIADLAGEERVSAVCLAEALQYRAYESRKFAMPQ